MGKKVIFARAFHVDPEPRLEKAARWIKEIDSTIEIIAIGWDRTQKSKKEEYKNGILIKRFFAKGEYGKGFRKNIVGLILFNMYLFWIFMTREVHVIHACDLDTAIPAFIASRLKRVKLVYDIYDFYSDNRNLGFFDTPIRKLEKKIARLADLTIIADERRLKQIADLDDVNMLDNVITIYNTPEDNFSHGNVPCKYLVSYVGVLIEKRNIIEVANVIRNIGEVKMICAGFGLLEDEILALAQKSSNVLFLGKVSYEEAIKIEEESNVILAMYDPSIPNNRFAAPNKLCEAMMLSKPIITSAGTLCGELVKEEDIGFVVSHDDKEALIDTLLYIRANPEVVYEMGKRARALYERKYSAKIAKARLKEKYEYLLYDNGGLT